MYILHKDEYTITPPSKEGFSFIMTKADCNPACPLCQGRLITHDWSKRRERCLDGSTKVYKVKDCICLNCGRMHRLLPDFLVPHKHYGYDAIEEMIVNDTEDTLDKYPDTVNEFTIKRFKGWWAVMNPYFLAIISSLLEKFGDIYQKRPHFREIVRAVTNSCRWTFPTHLVLMPG